MRGNGDQARLECRAPWLGNMTSSIEISLELFPPRTADAEVLLASEVQRMQAVQPNFVSVTCGAGGNPAEGTADLIGSLRRDGIEAVPHLTCASASRDEIDQIAHAYRDAGVRRIVALRGDPPRDGGPYRPRPDGYAYASDLVAGLRAIGDFEISVACYPEMHPESTSSAADLANIRRKIDAGASRVISQYCFDTDRILRLRDDLATGGSVPSFAAGIMPIRNFTQLRRFSERCGAGIPDWLIRLFDGLDEEPATRSMVSAWLAAEQCRRLVAEGVDHLHIYTLNKADLTLALCRLLGIEAPLRAAA